MAYVVRMPKLGMQMQEGTLVSWSVALDEEVSAGGIIAEVETDKAVADVEASEDGVLRETFVEEGVTVTPGTPLGIIAGPDEDVSDLLADAGVEEIEVDETDDDEPAVKANIGISESRRITPRARKASQDLGVDLDLIEGSGSDGAVTADDVHQHAQQSEPARQSVLEARELSGMRRTISERLGESYRNAVHVTISREIDAGPMFGAADIAEDKLGHDVSVIDLVIAAVSRTFDDHPEFNAVFEDDVHRLIKEHNIGVAVDVDQGLVTPVVDDVGASSLTEIAQARRRLTEKCLSGEYTMDDLSGGTFTVSNLGVLGTDSFTPIINPPQVAILGVNRPRERAVQADGGVDFTPFMTFDLTIDHRVVDGADGARFLDTLDEQLTSAENLIE